MFLQTLDAQVLEVSRTFGVKRPGTAEVSEQ